MLKMSVLYVTTLCYLMCWEATSEKSIRRETSDEAESRTSEIRTFGRNTLGPITAQWQQPLEKRSRLLAMIVRKKREADKKHPVDHILYLGSKAQLPCFPKGETAEPTSSFAWEHHNNEPLKDKRYSVDEKGEMSISRVYPKDSGEFICTATDPVKEKTTKVQHKIKVVQMPSVGMHLLFTYKVKNCNGKLEYLAAKHVEKMVKSKFCAKNECKLGTVHGNCHQENSDKILRVTVPISVPEAPTDSCDSICTKKKFKVIEDEIKGNISDTVMKGEDLIFPGEKEGVKPSSFDEKTDKMCAPGFELIKDVCIPCLPGHFLDGEKCGPCPQGQYVAKFAATECHHCDDHLETNGLGAKSDDECLDIGGGFWSMVVVLCLFCAFSCLSVCYWIYWCVRKAAGDSAFGRVLDTFCKCITCDFKGEDKQQEKKTVVTFKLPSEDSGDEKTESDTESNKLTSTTEVSALASPPPPPPPPLPPLLNPNHAVPERSSLVPAPRLNPEIVSFSTESQSQHGRGDEILMPNRPIEKSLLKAGETQSRKDSKPQVVYNTVLNKRSLRELSAKVTPPAKQARTRSSKTYSRQPEMERSLAAATVSLNKLRDQPKSRNLTRTTASENLLRHSTGTNAKKNRSYK